MIGNAHPTGATGARPSRPATIVAAGLGLLFAAYGLWALASIPRGLREFTYENPAGGTAWWPLPFAPINGFTPEQLSSHLARALFLFPACVLLGFACQRFWPRRARTPPSVAIVAVGTLLTGAAAAFVIRGVPLQDDEATYVMQAELLTRGLVADPSHPATVRFAEPFTIFTRAGMTGMYLFGAPLVLAPGVSGGFPWIGQIVVVALTLWCAYQAAARAGGRAIAGLGAVLLAVSPMLIFTSAGALSQPSALAGIALAVLGLQIGRWSGGALVGTGLGFAFATRPQTAGAAALVLVAVYGWRDRRLLGGMLLAALPWALAVGAYNQALMGSPWQLPRAAYASEMEAYGFGRMIRTYDHTPLKAAALAAVAAVRLNGWALGWPVSLSGPALWFALGRPARAVVGPWLGVALATFLFQAGYGLIGTSETGPVYHYAVLPFVAFSTAAALRAVGSRKWGAWVQAAAAVSLLLGTTSFYVEHAWRLSRLSAAIEGPRRSLDLPRPVVLFEEVWGARPQVGWVFGLPFRERSPSSPIVRYPRPALPSHRDALIERWQDRHCRYLWYDWASSEYRVAPCSEIGLHDGDAARRRPPAVPWFANGGWRDAFPYLPGVGRSFVDRSSIAPAPGL